MPSVYLKNYHYPLLSPNHTSYQQPIYIQSSNHGYEWHKRHILVSGWFYLWAFNPRRAQAQLEILGLLWLLHSLSWRLLLFELFPSASLGTAVTCWETRCPLKHFWKTQFLIASLTENPVSSHHILCGALFSCHLNDFMSFFLSCFMKSFILILVVCLFKQRNHGAAQ